MRKRYDHVSYERVCSGSALPDLYNFMKEKQQWNEPVWCKKALEDAEDQAPLIVQAAFDNEEPREVCRRLGDLYL